MESHRIISPIALLVILFINAVKGSLDIAEGKDYLKHHGVNTSNADLVFLLDRSGSLGAANFETELGFVASFLTNFVVAPDATRVAVISFSDDAEVHIDYLKDKANKCRVAQDVSKIEYTNSRATNTGAGLQKALDVFKNARPDCQKILVLVTDGLATLGQDPVEVARALKNSGVQIHVFGIGRYLKPALEAIASSPDHVLECESFTVFRNMYGMGERKRWSTEDTAEACHSKCYNPDNNNGCCDANAICGCSLSSGVNDCLCKPGYFGKGLQGNCTPCDEGTYNDEYGQGACKYCEMNSRTEGTGSSSMGDCKCDPGYKGNPAERIPCTKVTCPPLQPPANGRLQGECDTNHNAECYFECNEGYVLADGSTSYRVCEEDGTWSSETPVCIPIRCDTKPLLINGSLNCPDGTTFNKACSYSCHRGYKLEGPTSTTCVGPDQWSGGLPKCKLVGCGKPPDVQNSRPTGISARKTYSFSDTYVIRCKQGFKLVGSPLYVCDESGRWQPQTTQPPQCNDITPPTISCPQDITIEAERHRNTARLTWGGPRVRDNSGKLPIIKQYPEDLTSPATLEIGQYVIVYQAVDHFNFASNCTMRIQVVDKEPPQVTYCPEDIRVNTTSDEAEVHWNEPQFSDNSGGTITITPNQRSGDLLTYGTHQIVYRAVDPSKNVALCKFNVHVSKSRCTYYPPPVNGALTCEEMMHGDLCEVLCNENYDFVSIPAEYYICDANLTWTTEPEGLSVPWPDCSETSSPNMKKKFQGHYFTGDCRDPSVQDAVRKIFQKNFQAYNAKDKVCGKKISCELHKVFVYCGKTEDSMRNKRRRRSPVSPEEQYSVADVDAELLFTPLMNVANDIEELSENLDALFSDFGEIPQYMLEDVMAETNVSLEMKLIDSSFGDAFLLCGEGKVLSGNQCVMCTRGTYHDKTQDLCVPCAKGEYQDEEGSTSCKLCPTNTMTETLKSTSIDDCRAVCTEGTYSLTGIETCRSCPRGTYQDMTHQTSCKACPKGSTTETIGSTGIQDCKRLCSPGTVSETGLEPCSPCQKGYYQAYNGQRSCDECVLPLTTLEKGSVSSFDCLEFDHCISEPCRNNGTCESFQHDFTCTCPPGFYGKACENRKDACHDSPCLNGGSCTLLGDRFQCSCPADYEGQLCENARDLCLEVDCLNGGECVIEDAKVKCHCVPGYFGEECQYEMHVIKPRPVDDEYDEQETEFARAVEEFIASHVA